MRFTDPDDIAHFVRNDIAHFVRKLRSTLRMVCRLATARTFGKYRYSTRGDGFDYAIYKWRGQWYAFPTSTIDPSDANLEE